MKPLWKQLFDTVEQAAAPVVAEVTASNGFAEVMKVGLKINADMQKQAEAFSRQWLHAWNLPAAGDLAYLKGQIGSLETEVRSLRRMIESQNAVPHEAVPTKKAPPKRTPQKPAAKKPAAKKSAAKKSAAKKPAAKKPAARKLAVVS